MYVTLKTVLFVLAAAGFVLAAFGVGAPRVSLGWLAAASGTLAILIDSQD